MKGVDTDSGEGGWCATAGATGGDVSCGELEVDGIVSGEDCGQSCSGLSMRCETAPALRMVDERPMSVASESVGVAAVGICRVGRRAGTFAMEESFRGSCGFRALIGLVAALGVSFGATEDEVRLRVKDAVGRADTLAKSAVMSFRTS
jgi:hypothetical protein